VIGGSGVLAVTLFLAVFVRQRLTEETAAA
jgi:hypothetical protein